MLVKNKKISQISWRQDYDAECKCKHCRKLYKSDLKVVKKYERNQVKKYIKKNMEECYD